uniref:Uncharacterized protein n=1 Tax=Triticum urartu TaxID=4572 RepID=A0A8R7U549_TRIUA
RVEKKTHSPSTTSPDPQPSPDLPRARCQRRASLPAPRSPSTAAPRFPCLPALPCPLPLPPSAAASLHPASSTSKRHCPNLRHATRLPSAASPCSGVPPIAMPPARLPPPHPRPRCASRHRLLSSSRGH